MSNNLLTISKITNETLMVLKNSTTAANRISQEYNDQFAQTGAKIGATLNVRKPGRFIGTTGADLNVEDFNETFVPVTLTTQFHVDTQFSTQDLALSMDGFSDRVIKPAMAAIGNKIDRDVCVLMKNNTANIVGTAGSPASALLTYLTAGAYMDSEGAPRDGKRSVIIEPFTSAAIVDSLKGLFVPGQKISDQYTKGMMGRDSAGVDWYMDQNIVSQSFGYWAGGSASTLTANTTSIGIATGWASSSTVTLTQGATLTLNQGDIISFANVYAVNPQNRQAYGSNKLRTFVVNSTVTGSGSGTMSVSVSPAIVTAGQFQNVSISATSSTATVTLYSAGVSGVGVVSPQNIMLHKNAFCIAMADLPLPEGVHFAGRAADADVGMSVRIVRANTINNDSIPARFDVLYGTAPLYPELACRVAA